MKKLQQTPNFHKEKILQNLTIDGEGTGCLSAVEIDLNLSRTFLLNLLSDFIKGKKDMWQLKDAVDVFCGLQESLLMQSLKEWNVEVTGVSLTIFINEDQINSQNHPFIIEWAVLDLFRNPAVYKISLNDVFIIKKFLTTPFYHFLAAFKEWEHYWHVRGTEVRGIDHDKKLLEAV